MSLVEVWNASLQSTVHRQQAPLSTSVGQTQRSHVDRVENEMRLLSSWNSSLCGVSSVQIIAAQHVRRGVPEAQQRTASVAQSRSANLFSPVSSDRRTDHAPGASSSNENRTALVMSFVWRAESRESCTIGSRMLRQCSFRYVVAMRSWNLEGSVQHTASETAYLSAISWFPA